MRQPHTKMELRHARRLSIDCVAVSLLALLLFVPPLSAGECVDSMNPDEIIRRLSDVDPDDLPPEADYLLGCLDFAVGKLSTRPGGDYLPSWRLLRNTRRAYRDRRRKPELVAVLKPLLQSSSARVRLSAATGLVLYGETSYADSLLASHRPPAWK